METLKIKETSLSTSIQVVYDQWGRSPQMEIPAGDFDIFVDQAIPWLEEYKRNSDRYCDLNDALSWLIENYMQYRFWDSLPEVVEYLCYIVEQEPKFAIHENSDGPVNRAIALDTTGRVEEIVERKFIAITDDTYIWAIRALQYDPTSIYWSKVSLEEEEEATKTWKGLAEDSDYQRLLDGARARISVPTADIELEFEMKFLTEWLGYMFSDEDYDNIDWKFYMKDYSNKEIFLRKEQERGHVFEVCFVKKEEVFSIFFLFDNLKRISLLNPEHYQFEEGKVLIGKRTLKWYIDTYRLEELPKYQKERQAQLDRGNENWLNDQPRALPKPSKRFIAVVNLYKEFSWADLDFIDVDQLLFDEMRVWVYQKPKDDAVLYLDHLQKPKDLQYCEWGLGGKTNILLKWGLDFEYFSSNREVHWGHEKFRYIFEAVEQDTATVIAEMWEKGVFDSNYMGAYFEIQKILQSLAVEE